MKIGIDAASLTNQRTGVGNYLFYILEELVRQRPLDHFYLYAIRKSRSLHHFEHLHNVMIRTNSTFGFSEALWSQTTLSGMCYQDHLDLFWGTGQSIPLFKRRKQRQAITIYDFTYRLYPQTTTFVRGAYLKALGRLFYLRADLRVTISQATAERLSNLYTLSSHGVIPPPLKPAAPSSHTHLADYGLEPKNFFLLVGTLEPRKNLLAALEIYSEVTRTTPLPPLVLVGKRGWKSSALEKKLAAMKNVKTLGYLPDDQVQFLMQQAKATILPSLYEGYGMPIAESRSLGTPVICSKTPEMIEAAEGDALFIDLPDFSSQFKQALLNPPPSLTKPCSYPTTAASASRLSSLFNQFSS
jgi:glycosyltransferase involved in cell wall biosynthesis